MSDVTRESILVTFSIFIFMRDESVCATVKSLILIVEVESLIKFASSRSMKSVMERAAGRVVLIIVLIRGFCWGRDFVGLLRNRMPSISIRVLILMFEWMVLIKLQSKWST